MITTATIRRAKSAAATCYAARRLHDELSGEVAAVHGRLYEADDPAARAALLSDHAELLLRMSDNHAKAYGAVTLDDGRTMRESLASSASLYRLIAATERALADAEWTPAEELLAHGPLWFAGEFTHVTETTETAPGVIRITFRHDDGETQTLEWGADECVRTGGPAQLDEVTALAKANGATGDEVAEWVRLGTIRDRAHRSALLTSLATMYVANRLGGQAVEDLHAVADSEAHLMCEAAGHPHPLVWFRMPRFRTLVVALFTVVAGVALVPGLPDWARWAIVAGLAASAWLGMRLLVSRADRTQANPPPAPGELPVICMAAESCSAICLCGHCPALYGRGRRRRTSLLTRGMARQLVADITGGPDSDGRNDDLNGER